ncbi:MAG TPA: efflux RND transporter periplasmic adaptor subunit [Lacunisphaera sp.]|nr:efflux RND transporter periplasmic adaptor subunit [Lacunisphaera sp.]
MKQKILISLLALAVAGSATWFLRRPHGKAGRAAGGERAPMASPARAAAREGAVVRTVVVQTRPLEETVVATGTVRADESVDLQPEIAGKLVHIHFVEGTRVRAGELLAVLNDAELRASLQRAIFRRELAELKARRILTLIDKGGVPQQDYDIAASELSVLGAEVELIRAQLIRTEVRAPFDGIIGLRSVSEGAQVSPTTRLTTLQDVRHVKIDFSVAEKYARVLRPGSRVSFSVAGSTLAYPAEVYAVEPYLDEATRTRLIRARADNPDGTLLPGAFARVTVPVAKLDAAVVIPATAVAAEAGEKSVFVVEHGKARRQIVQTGLRLDESVLVTTGLHAGDEVIVAGTQVVRTGTAVDPAPSPPGQDAKRLKN